MAVFRPAAAERQGAAARLGAPCSPVPPPGTRLGSSHSRGPGCHRRTCTARRPRRSGPEPCRRPTARWQHRTSHQRRGQSRLRRSAQRWIAGCRTDGGTSGGAQQCADDGAAGGAVVCGVARNAGLLQRPLTTGAVVTLELLEGLPCARQRHHAGASRDGGARGQQQSRNRDERGRGAHLFLPWWNLDPGLRAGLHGRIVGLGAAAVVPVRLGRRRLGRGEPARPPAARTSEAAARRPWADHRSSTAADSSSTGSPSRDHTPSPTPARPRLRRRRAIRHRARPPARPGSTQRSPEAGPRRPARSPSASSSVLLHRL